MAKQTHMTTSESDLYFILHHSLGWYKIHLRVKVDVMQSFWILFWITPYSRETTRAEVIWGYLIHWEDLINYASMSYGICLWNKLQLNHLVTVFHSLTPTTVMQPRFTQHCLNWGEKRHEGRRWVVPGDVTCIDAKVIQTVHGIISRTGIQFHLSNKSLNTGN